MRTGQISDRITDSGCRNAATLILKPNPELADLMENICSCKSWDGIIRKLWPKTKYISAACTGSMMQYTAELEFYCGGLPLVSGSYGCSEGASGINLEPLCKPSDVSYTLLPNTVCYEFVPAKIDCVMESQNQDLFNCVSPGESTETKSGDEDTKPVDLVNVKLGQCYELLVTSSREYSSCGDTSSTPGHYVIFWELKEKEGNNVNKLDLKVMEECCSRMEDSLHYTYRLYRKENIIEALEIRVVKQGTFEALMDYFISRGASLSQYKTPVCIKSKEALEILDSRVIAKFFSPKTPMCWRNLPQMPSKFRTSWGVKYLRRFLHGQTDKLLFKKNVPIVAYEDLKPYSYIDRIANGEASLNILLAESVTGFSLRHGTGTSGGQPKLIPVTGKSVDLTPSFVTLYRSVMTKRESSIYSSGCDSHFGDKDGAGKRMELMFAKPDIENPSGLKASAVSSRVFKSIQALLPKLYTSPFETIFCPDTKQSMYCQLLFGLIQQDVVIMIGSFFASTVLRGFKFLENNWQELCPNIRTGQISDRITDLGCRNAASLILKPNPELADLIENIWLPLVSGFYGCSEGALGINLEPLCKPSDVYVSYTFLPDVVYYEFVPIKEECVTESQNRSWRRFYGDRLPQQSTSIPICGERTSEADFLRAVMEAKPLLNPLGFILTEYTRYGDTSSTPDHYVIFWELKAKEGNDEKELDPKVMEECCSRIEDSLHFTYRINFFVGGNELAARQSFQVDVILGQLRSSKHHGHRRRVVGPALAPRSPSPVAEPPKESRPSLGPVHSPKHHGPISGPALAPKSPKHHGPVSGPVLAPKSPKRHGPVPGPALAPTSPKHHGPVVAPALRPTQSPYHHGPTSSPGLSPRSTAPITKPPKESRPSPWPAHSPKHHGPVSGPALAPTSPKHHGPIVAPSSGPTRSPYQHSPNASPGLSPTSTAPVAEPPKESRPSPWPAHSPKHHGPVSVPALAPTSPTPGAAPPKESFASPGSSPWSAHSPDHRGPVSGPTTSTPSPTYVSPVAEPPKQSSAPYSVPTHPPKTSSPSPRSASPQASTPPSFNRPIQAPTSNPPAPPQAIPSQSPIDSSTPPDTQIGSPTSEFEPAVAPAKAFATATNSSVMVLAASVFLSMVLGSFVGVF
ncbi:Indole-3-acetic acid-amido synthetase GH3.17 [Hibiscus syriacus]|uniref:Indole-3-acetic acid-amido synthetase GH3.17 n=1 Tax=Hibiscus syriacus TaxID=106335 RepID=A0A6A2WM52_HIBSY|nr:Indole-3-acetic acid-amido synthetase GH3.17 [Hibiscus syriacus]